MGAVPDFDHDQWPRRCTGFSDRGASRLRLIVELEPGDAVCDVFVEERSERIEIEVVACRVDAPDGSPHTEIYLRTPLNGRRLIDLTTGAEIPRLAA